jgi:hypothetical protein
MMKHERVRYLVSSAYSLLIYQETSLVIIVIIIIIIIIIIDSTALRGSWPSSEASANGSIQLLLLQIS